MNPMTTHYLILIITTTTTTTTTYYLANRFGGGASEREFWTRTLGFTFLTIVGIVPNIHLTLITPTNWLSLQPYILAMFTSYGTGLFFYVSKVPESIFPTFVNRSFFTSHVIWHFGVIAGITVWGVALLKAQSLMRHETCDAWGS